MRYEGAPRKSLQEIARELHVDAIVEGTVLQSGQRVRITAQLIRASDARHLLSEQYERELFDILALQGEVARAIINDGPLFQALLGYAYGRAGDRAKALAIVDELTKIRMAKQRFVSPMDFAIVYAGMGDSNMTFQWLENAYQSRDTRIHQLPSMEFDSVRSDPRYAALMRRVGLPLQVPAPK